MEKYVLLSKDGHHVILEGSKEECLDKQDELIRNNYHNFGLYYVETKKAYEGWVNRGKAYRENQRKQLNNPKVFLARDKQGELSMFLNEKPVAFAKSGYEDKVWWGTEMFGMLSDKGGIKLNRNLFPDVTFENSPVEMNIIPAQK